jgi:hypothetical protein
VPLENRTCFQVNLRDGLRCRGCGRGPTRRETYHRGFGYHHVTPQSRGGPDVIENVVLLCRVCHDAHHAGRRTLAFGPQAAPGGFDCGRCGHSIDPDVVIMNCGWYACPRCDQRIHLFDHFGFEETAK